MSTITEVARVLDVDRESVKRWTTTFAEHFSLTAKPPKGGKRQFSESDLCVLAFIADQVEAGADDDEIHAMLNGNGHNEGRFLDFARLHTPIFQDTPAEIDETWQHGALIGGMANRDLVDVARSYKMAADELVKQALVGNYESHELDYPILFLCRHCLELYLKVVLKTKKHVHNLGSLIEELEKQEGNPLAAWVRKRLHDFNDVDVMSDLFRYADPVPHDELWIDFNQLQAVLNRMVEAFEQHIRAA